MLKNKSWQGLLYMAFACFLASIMIAMVRFLSDKFHSSFIVLMRNLFSVIFFVPLFIQDYKKILHTKKIGHHFLRGLNGTLTMMCWFYTISVLPLQEAVSLSFLSPILTILAGQLFLQERINKYTYFSCLLSFAGVLIILRPGFKNISLIYLVPLISVLLWVISNLVVKMMTKTEKPTTIVAYMSIFMLFFSIPFGLMHLQKITLLNLFLFAMLGLISNLSHMYLAKAYSVSDLATVSPIDFTRLIFISLIAYFVFHEKPDFYVFVGSGIILVAMILISKKPKIINNTVL